MEYIYVHWRHQPSKFPEHLYSELDNERNEVRKVEIFRDGTMGFADEIREHLGTGLGEMPVPPLEEIAQDPEFFPRKIDKTEFEMAWRRATEHVLPPRPPR